LAAARCLFYSLASTTCAGFGPSTAPCANSRAGATCAGLGPSAAVACRMGAGQGNTPRTDQTGDAETGKEFFQVLAIHRVPPCLKVREGRV